MMVGEAVENGDEAEDGDLAGKDRGVTTKA
jgi:hypothetical protein